MFEIWLCSNFIHINILVGTFFVRQAYHFNMLRWCNQLIMKRQNKKPTDSLMKSLLKFVR